LKEEEEEEEEEEEAAAGKVGEKIRDVSECNCFVF
jgi:hypothetical protein